MINAADLQIPATFLYIGGAAVVTAYGISQVYSKLTGFWRINFGKLSVQDYYPTARENEEVFRNVLTDLRDSREERPMERYVPKDLDPEMELDEIFQRYSRGYRRDKFTITNFTRPDESRATIELNHLTRIRSKGVGLEYLVRGDNSVKYQQPSFTTTVSLSPYH